MNKEKKEINKLVPLEEKKTQLQKILKKSKSIFGRDKAKEKILVKQSSGIPQFDKMTAGGFEGDSINLVAGGSGSGKTIFALQFLLEGIKKGEKVLYVSFQEKKKEVYANMKKFGWDIEKYEKENKFIFLEYSPEKVKMMLDEGGGSIESLVLKYKITRMVIDSITSFSLLFDDQLSKRQANLALFDIISKWDCTTLLTVQHDPSDKLSDELASIEFEADSITLLHFRKIKGIRKRFIEILKMRGTNHSTETRSFMIGKKGFEIGKIFDFAKK